MCTCMQWILSFHMSQDMLTFLTAMASQASDIICWTIAWLCTQKRSSSTQQTTSNFSSIFLSKNNWYHLISSDTNNRCFLMILEERRRLRFEKGSGPTVSQAAVHQHLENSSILCILIVYYNILYYILCIYIYVILYTVYMLYCIYIYIYHTV